MITILTRYRGLSLQTELIVIYLLLNLMSGISNINFFTMSGIIFFRNV